MQVCQIKICKIECINFKQDHASALHLNQRRGVFIAHTENKKFQILNKNKWKPLVSCKTHPSNTTLTGKIRGTLFFFSNYCSVLHSPLFFGKIINNVLCCKSYYSTRKHKPPSFTEILNQPMSCFIFVCLFRLDF